MLPTVIDGTNDLTSVSPPLAALIQFYAGFNGRDVKRSMQAWAQDDSVSMCNPIGGIRRGYQAIDEGYQLIMQGKTRVYVEFYDYQFIECGEVFYAVGRERGYAEKLLSDGQQSRIELAIRTSRVFRKNAANWRQVHHHGSLDDPALLKRYQDFIRGSLQVD
ncbi:MAG: nuclear transport factor 2 family protein [Thioalkalispiraceae bacterium]|jgi:ketosteroid isomerase-like protein